MVLAADEREDDGALPVAASHSGTMEAGQRGGELVGRGAGDAMSEVPITTPTEARERVERLLATYRQERERAVTALREDRDHFAARLRQTWADAVDAYDFCTIVAHKIGQAFHIKHQAGAVARNDATFEALTRLHSQAMVVASEVRALLLAGYAQGALARSRSMHELAVIATFIVEHGQETSERFIAHKDFEEYRLLKTYHDYAVQSGLPGLDEAALAAAKTRRDQLRQTYDKRVLEDYGWAGGAICPTSKKQAITFRHLEQAADLEDGRPYYRLASGAIHIGSLGNSAHILSVDGIKTYSVAPSIRGLHQPAGATLVALLHCTFIYLSLAWDEYHDPGPLAEVHVLTTLVQEATGLLLSTERELEARFD